MMRENGVEVAVGPTRYGVRTGLRSPTRPSLSVADRGLGVGANGWSRGDIPC